MEAKWWRVLNQPRCSISWREMSPWVKMRVMAAFLNSALGSPGSTLDRVFRRSRSTPPRTPGPPWEGERFLHSISSFNY